MRYAIILVVVQAISANDYGWKPEELDELSHFTKSVLDYKPTKEDIILRYGSDYERKIYSEPVELMETDIE
jgi:hypothetical protein